MAGYIETYCLEFAKSKGINIDNPRERERERVLCRIDYCQLVFE
jgi:hypothetical protein